jgi:hypothetical protein
VSNIAPAYVTLNPNYTMPELLLPYSQASGAFETLPDGEPMVRLGEGDLLVYMNRVDLRTKMTAAQSAANELPSVEVVLSQLSTPSYLLRVRAEYDHHDTAAMSRRNMSIVEAQRLGMRQGHFQLLRSMLLFGMNPVYGEGFLNSAGTVAVNLPADTYGNDTVLTYDNGQMAFFILQQIANLKSRTNQMGIGRTFVILGPQRDLGVWEYSAIVQLVQYQRVGAGTEATAGVVKEMLMKNGDLLIWAYDDTLIGAGAGGNDAVLIVMPEVQKPKGQKINTNVFAEVRPGYEGCTAMLCDMIAPKEIMTPIAGGAVDVVSELRSTSGWAPRPEALTIISMAY